MCIYLSLTEFLMIDTDKLCFYFMFFLHLLFKLYFSKERNLIVHA